MPSGLFRFVARRIIAAAVLVLVASSAAMVLARLAPGDHLAGFGVDPLVAAAECERVRCHDPLLVQYVSWLRRTLLLDLGVSSRYHRPVFQLVEERASNSFLLGVCALVAATLLGIPAGVLTGSRRTGIAAATTRTASILLLACPPLVSALALLLLASLTGWFPIGGMPPGDAPFSEHVRHLVLPVVALSLPMAATLERLQSRAMFDALAHPCVRAASARGLEPRRVVWRHALRLSLTPVLGIYGIVIGSLISGSFIVEYIMAWPGLGSLMYEALVARDAFLVAGCAAAGAVALAFGILVSDIALAAVDPRLREPA